jgi:hypothetical protein
VKKWSLVIVYMIACVSPCLATSSAATSRETTRQIQQVIDAFRTSIVTKDGATLARLPFTKSIPFTPVYDDAYLALARAKRPDMRKAQPIGYSDFVKYVVSSKDREEEKFSNVLIHSDGQVATIYFDYSFAVNDVVTNWGHETWGLIKTDEGWKISSIVWSVSVDLKKLKDRG